MNINLQNHETFKVVKPANTADLFSTFFQKLVSSPTEFQISVWEYEGGLCFENLKTGHLHDTDKHISTYQQPVLLELFGEAVHKLLAH